MQCMLTSGVAPTASLLFTRLLGALCCCCTAAHNHRSQPW
jgi:hypothetical protein